MSNSPRRIQRRGELNKIQILCNSTLTGSKRKKVVAYAKIAGKIKNSRASKRGYAAPLIFSFLPALFSRRLRRGRRKGAASRARGCSRPRAPARAKETEQKRAVARQAALKKKAARTKAAALRRYRPPKIERTKKSGRAASPRSPAAPQRSRAKPRRGYK